MANTEGMSDERMHDLLSISPAELNNNKNSNNKNSNNSNNSNNNNNNNNSDDTEASPASSFVQRRMEMPMGSQPAAKVIRRSNRRNTKKIGNNSSYRKRQTVVPTNTTDGETTTTTTTTTTKPPPVLKSIIERPRNHPTETPTPQGERSTKSKFAMRRKQVPTTNGFPSLHQPIGTFTNTYNHPKIPNSHTGTTTTTNTNTNTTATPLGQQHSTATSTSTTKHAKGRTAKTPPEMTTATREADSMIQGMSKLEIQQQLEELQSVMSPDTLEFLKKRGMQKKQQQQQQQQQSITDVDTKLPAPTLSTSHPTIIKTTDEIQEKKRIAQLLSSVKTFEEMDEVYEKEMTTDETQTPSSSSSNSKPPTTKTLTEQSELEQAYALLRSSAPRQTLWAAKTVCQHLEKQQQQQQQQQHRHTNQVLLSSADPPHYRIGSSNESEWPYPILLPVSLRCLLDAPASHSNGLELHSYVLRCFYVLLLIRSPQDHCVDVKTTLSSSQQSLFHTHFMADNLPTLPFGSQYPKVSVKPVMSNPQGETVAYATSSSSKSASEDGQTFLRDPLWTLLSKMKIVPRLASLLLLLPKQQSQQQQHESPPAHAPEETLICICGILAMLSARSPGATAAIGQHKTLLRSLLDLTVLPPSPTKDTIPELFLKVSVTRPVLTLLRTMARQSRAVASSLVPYFDWVVPPLLAMRVSSTTDDFLSVHTEGLLLWRTMLRYGLGLAHLSSFLALSISHLGSTGGSHTDVSNDNNSKAALNKDNTTLVPFYLSCFAAALECAKISHRSVGSSSLKLSNDEMDIMDSMIDWLLPTAKQCVKFITSFVADEHNELGDQQLAASVAFVASYCNACNHHLIQGENGAILEESEEAMASIDYLKPLLMETDLISQVKLLVESSALRRHLSKTPMLMIDHNPLYKQEEEAVACSLIDALVALVSALQKYSESHGDIMGNINILAQSLSYHFISWITKGSDGQNEYSNAEQTFKTVAQKAWINQCHFSVAKFVMANHYSDSKTLTMEQQKQHVRCFVFNLIGRLRLGDEAKTAILFSNDSLFLEQNNKEHTSSPLSSMLMQEICSSPEARAQLDHSFKLHRGFGITSDGHGPFATTSLLSEAEKGASPGSSSPQQLLLPLGKAWLWKILSGSIKSNNEHLDDSLTLQVKEVLASCLELLLEMEQFYRDSATRSLDGVAIGTKVYYLMNICLYPEVISGDNQIGTLVSKLLHALLKGYNDDGSDNNCDHTVGNYFISSCFEHSLTTTAHASSSEDSKNEKLLAVISGTPDTSSRMMRATVEFLADFCNTFIEFGAQYQLFSDVVIACLRPVFPAKLQSEVLTRIREMVHLLVVSDADNVDGDAAVKFTREAVSSCIRNGVPSINQHVQRDAGGLLDLVCDILRRYTGEPSSFFWYYSIAIISRNLSGAILSKTGMAAFKRRLANCPVASAGVIIRTTSALLEMGPDVSSNRIVEVVFKENATTNKLLDKVDMNSMFNQWTE